MKPLVRLLGSPGGNYRNAQNESRPPSDEPDPIRRSRSQREQIERRIAEFIADSSSVYAHAFAAIARVNVLPLYFDWTAFMALRWDGQIVWVLYDDEPGEIEMIRDERLRNFGLFRATRLHPDLLFLSPPRPPDAIDCTDCMGTGKLTFPPGHEHLAETVICYCGGIGWLPHGEKR